MKEIKAFVRKERLNEVVKIEIESDDENVEKIIDVLRRHAQTGKSGDGLIYVSSLDYSVRIRTGERNLGPSSHSH